MASNTNHLKKTIALKSKNTFSVKIFKLEQTLNRKLLFLNLILIQDEVQVYLYTERYN